MSTTTEHLFGLGPGHLPAGAACVAERHGATLVNYTEPRGQRRHWFAGPNRGEPFDSRLRASVMADLRAAGFDEEG